MKPIKAAFFLLVLLGGHPAAARSETQHPGQTQQPAHYAEEQPRESGRPERLRPFGIAYLDADHLYDTVPSPFYDDSDYTPQGPLRWNTARYRRKTARTAALIDSLGLPVVALWSVENEQVVRDIAAACQGDYTYLHRTLNSLDGMDFALLYSPATSKRAAATSMSRASCAAPQAAGRDSGSGATPWAWCCAASSACSAGWSGSCATNGPVSN